MKKAAIFTASALALAACATTRQYRQSEAWAHSAALRAHAEQIQIGRIAVRQETLGQMLADVEKRSIENDPRGTGIRFRVPSEFRGAYENIRDQRLTITLGPRLTMNQFLAELPLDASWTLFPLSDHEVAIIPVDRVVTNGISSDSRAARTPIDPDAQRNDQ